jgi:hypothetical protein
MASSSFQLYIELKDSTPKIWRRFLVPSDVLLSDLHLIIQTVMGWTNSHLHHFIKNRTFYEPPAEDDFWDSTGKDYTGMTLNALLKKKSDQIEYEYDFGDGWDHKIVLEEIIDEELDHPVCIDGEMACPPEDVGGVGGYEFLKEVLNDPDHPEYDYFAEWHDPNFDPTDFDIDVVNEMLNEEDFGALQW